jgi:hypothetical protein
MNRAVFTSLMGNYERQIDKEAGDQNLEYFCFTDNPRLSISGWETVVVDPLFPLDSVRSARALKIRGHEVLSAYDECLWLDNRIELLVSPVELFDLLLPGDAQFGAPLHSFRSTVADEFREVLRHGYDDPRRVREQYSHYKIIAPDVLMEKPIWTAIVARKNTPDVARFNGLWADSVLRYSRRDQLSVRHALSISNINAFCPAIDNIESPYHRWIDEASMNRRRDVSRWGAGARIAGKYSARDWVEDSVLHLRRTTSLARSAIRSGWLGNASRRG